MHEDKMARSNPSKVNISADIDQLLKDYRRTRLGSRLDYFSLEAGTVKNLQEY